MSKRSRRNHSAAFKAILGQGQDPRAMHAVVVLRDAPHALDPLALPVACSHSQEIGFRKADARDRLKWVGFCLSHLARSS